MNGTDTYDNYQQSVIEIGDLIEVIDDHGNWNEAEILNIVDNNLVVKIFTENESVNHILDISSGKWRQLINSSSKLNAASLSNDDFQKGDVVLAKWHDNNYYLSQILNVNSKTKFGTKVKEYHIIYLYDNIEETVPHSWLKMANNNSDDKGKFNTPTNDMNNKSIMSRGRRATKRSFVKRNSENALDTQKSNDNIIYDEKTKNFTEKCKIRRLRLSKDSDKSSADSSFENQLSRYVKTDVNNKDLVIVENVALKNANSNSKRIIPFDSSQTPNLKRISQKRRRCSNKKPDYFYPESYDHLFTSDKDKFSKSNSQVSTPIPCDDFSSSSPKIYNNHNCPAIHLDSKDYNQSSNHSPISVSLTSEESPKSKFKSDFGSPDVDTKDNFEYQKLYSFVEDGKFRCLICNKKTFRKKQMVLDHIKHYHATFQNQINCQYDLKIIKPKYSPPKRYYSSYLKNSRSSFEKKKQMKQFNRNLKTNFSGRYLWSERSGVNNKPSLLSKSEMSKSFIETDAFEEPDLNVDVTLSERKSVPSIVYCHRCKKSNEDGCLMQCDVCLCWSHALCYGFNDNKDNDNFWECDNCSNKNFVNDDNKTLEWYRDQWRFHSVPKNELPWLLTAIPNYKSSLKNIYEMQSLLSLCQKVLESIARHIDKLSFKNSNDSNSQDELDLLKGFYGYENIEDININRIEPLESLNLNSEQDELFRLSDNVNTSNSDHHFPNTNSKQPEINEENPTDTSNNASTVINQPEFPFNDIHFSNSTPNKCPTNGHKLVNTSLDGIFDCDIQKLDMIPKADFDALVKDLNSCDDICKQSNSEHDNKSSILDLFNDDGIQSAVVNKSDSTLAAVDSVMPFTKPPQTVYQKQQPEHQQSENDQHEPIIDISSDELDSFLLDKESQKTSLCEDMYVLDENFSKYSKKSPISKFHNADIQSKFSATKNTSSEAIPNISSFNKCSSRFVEDSGNSLKSPDKTSFIQSDQKLVMELSDLNAIIQPGTGNIVEPESASVFVYNEPKLSHGDSTCLHWLLCKYRFVEKIVESVESTLVSYEQSQPSSVSESDLNRISKYLQSLLFIFRRNENE